MERLILIVEQLEECKRLILDGGLSQLRMALLLLDNAAEIMMYRQMKSEFAVSRMYENTLKSLETLQRHDMETKRREELNQRIKDLQERMVPLREKRQIARYFDEKVKFLTQRKCMGESVAAFLASMHRYRNSAHHQDKVRKETLRPAVLMLFEVVCDLIVSLQPSSMSWSSSEDYSKFEKRYGLSAMDAGGERGRALIRSHLRQELPLEFLDLRNELVNHLEARLEDLIQALEFVAENVSEKGDLEGALKHIEFWFPRGDPSKSPRMAFEVFVPRHNMSELESWKTGTQALQDLNDKLVLFSEFARYESLLEPIEELVYEAAAAIDHAIDMEIDRMRGK